MQALRILKSRFVTHTPLILTHRLTSLCNCQCFTCDLWKCAKEHKEDLTRNEIEVMLNRAKKAGIIAYTVWGGEPLMRKDLGKILRYAKKELKFITMVITNGYYLKEQYKTIIPYTDFLVVSIDSNDGLHDEMRRKKGILTRALEGIKLAKANRANIIINSVISRINYSKIDGLLTLSKELGVTHAFEPMDTNGKYFKAHAKFKLEEEQQRRIFKKIIAYKRAGYRIANSIQYLENIAKQQDYCCHFPKTSITVDPHGNIGSCFESCWGNVKINGFNEIFTSIKFQDFLKKAEKCNICEISCAIELSFLYSLNPFFIMDKAINMF